MIRQQQQHLCRVRLSDYASVIDVGIQFAFQPLVNAGSGEVTGNEALVRGCSGESAAQVIASVRPENLFYFDQACRLGAVQEASRRGIETDIHLNCTEVDPGTLAMALSSTAEAVVEFGLEPGRIVLEFNALERLGKPRQLAEVRAQARHYGFRVLADNFGTGEAGLKRLAVFQPDFVKLDRELIANIHQSRRRQAMVLGILASCRALGIEPIAAGVEREAEVRWLCQAGVDRMQGFYFARPRTANRSAMARERMGSHAFSACAA